MIAYVINRYDTTGDERDHLFAFKVSGSPPTSAQVQQFTREGELLSTHNMELVPVDQDWIGFSLQVHGDCHVRLNDEEKIFEFDSLENYDKHGYGAGGYDNGYNSDPNADAIDEMEDGKDGDFYTNPSDNDDREPIVDDEADTTTELHDPIAMTSVANAYLLDIPYVHYGDVYLELQYNGVRLLADKRIWWSYPDTNGIRAVGTTFVRRISIPKRDVFSPYELAYPPGTLPQLAASGELTYRIHVGDSPFSDPYIKHFMPDDLYYNKTYGGRIV